MRMAVRGMVLQTSWRTWDPITAPSRAPAPAPKRPAMGQTSTPSTLQVSPFSPASMTTAANNATAPTTLPIAIPVHSFDLRPVLTSIRVIEERLIGYPETTTLSPVVRWRTPTKLPWVSWGLAIRTLAPRSGNPWACTGETEIRTMASSATENGYRILLQGVRETLTVLDASA